MKVASAALVLLLAGCVSPTPAPEPAGRIDGAVVDQFLNPHGNVTVTLVEADRAATTSRLGGFTFRDVPPGIHTVQVTLDGTRFVREQVDVRDEAIARVILQLPVPEATVPRVAQLKHDGGTDLGLPGTACTSCSWSTRFQERPDRLVLEARWDSEDLSPVRMRIDLQDAHGHVVARFEGESPLTGTVDGADLPEDLHIQVRFHQDNELPAPRFAMETLLRLSYGEP